MKKNSKEDGFVRKGQEAAYLDKGSTPAAQPSPGHKKIAAKGASIKHRGGDGTFTTIPGTEEALETAEGRGEDEQNGNALDVQP